MRGARREVGIVRGERARIRARNGVICEARQRARPPALCRTAAHNGCRRRRALI